MKYTIAIGDIHGMFDKLQQLLDLIAQEYNYEDVQFVFLGDYIDRGPKSKEVVEVVQHMQQKHGAIALRGNHEDMPESGQKMLWLDNGGIATMKSYGWDGFPGHSLNFDPLIEWIRTLPLYYEDERRVYVHAGIEPNVPMDKQDKQDLLWIRHYFLNYEESHYKYVVHGHTPTLFFEQKHAMILNNRCNLDTGACFGGFLTGAVFTDEQTQPIRLLEV